MRVKFIVLLCLLQPVDMDDSNGPNNTAVLSGSTVVLHCSEPTVTSCGREPLSNNSEETWKFFQVGSIRNVFGQIQPERYSYNETCDGQYDVIIKETKLEDAGAYRCTPQSGLVHEAQLIVLDSEPRCSFNDTALDEDAIRCTINFHSNNWSPEMKWQTVKGQVLVGEIKYRSNSTTSVLKRSTILSLVKEPTAEFKCETFFESNPNKPDSTPNKRFADNIPTFQHVWISPVIKIHSGNSFNSTQRTDEVAKQADTNKTGLFYVLPTMTAIIALILFLIAFLTTVTAIYFVKKYKKQKCKRNREAQMSMECYAEISQRGNMSMDNGSLQLNSVAFQQYDEVSVSTRGPPHYPQYRHFEEDDIAAYSETRTIASIPANFTSGKSMLSLNQQHIPKSADSFEVASRPSVDSAMPVYAEVQKPKNYRKNDNVSSSSKWSDATSDKSYDGMIEQVSESNVTKERERGNVGADGTEYVQVTDKSKDRSKDRKNIPQPKKTKEDAIYVGVDHTRRKPPPPPPFY